MKDQIKRRNEEEKRKEMEQKTQFYFMVNEGGNSESEFRKCKTKEF